MKKKEKGWKKEKKGKTLKRMEKGKSNEKTEKKGKKREKQEKTKKKKKKKKKKEKNEREKQVTLVRKCSVGVTRCVLCALFPPVQRIDKEGRDAPDVKFRRAADSALPLHLPIPFRYGGCWGRWRVTRRSS